MEDSLKISVKERFLDQFRLRNQKPYHWGIVRNNNGRAVLLRLLCPRACLGGFPSRACEHWLEFPCRSLPRPAGSVTYADVEAGERRGLL